MTARRIVVHDLFQDGYSYTRTEPAGKRFREDFTPDLSPEEMLRLGIFEGDYFGEIPAELPAAWFAHAKLSVKKKDPTLNCFGVSASQPLQYWREKGWIHPDDPRGWFQWYCRYYLGRRHPDDDRQIRRWKAIRRHIAQLQKHCPKGSVNCRPRQRQALLHWAVDSRKL